MCAPQSHTTTSRRAFALHSTLAIGAASLLVACGGSSGGTPAPGTATPIELPSTWSLSVEPQVVDVGEAIDIGLNGSEMVLEHLETAVEDGVNYSIFSVAIEGIDLDSRAEPGESMLRLLVDDFDNALFLTGMYYWPEGDLTVSIDIWPGSQGDWNGTDLSVVWRVRVYEGDVIEVHVDEQEEGEEAPEPEDVIRTSSEPICVMTLGVTAVPTTTSTISAPLPLAYEGLLDGRPIALHYDVVNSVVSLHEERDGAAHVGDFAVDGSGTFGGAGASWTVRGQVGESATRLVVVQHTRRGPRTLECIAARRPTND